MSEFSSEILLVWYVYEVDTVYSVFGLRMELSDSNFIIDCLKIYVLILIYFIMDVKWIIHIRTEDEDLVMKFKTTYNGLSTNGYRLQCKTLAKPNLHQNSKSK